MRMILIIAFVHLFSPALPQNVGIGTTTPSGKLQLNHKSSSVNPTLVIFDSSTSSAGRIKFLNAGGNRYWQISTILNNNSPAGQYVDFTTDSFAIMTLRGNGNVGIHNLTPTHKLDVDGDGRFTGTLRVEDTLGLGIINPSERLDVNGNINLNGLIKINGSSGTAGQVLTSNGTGDPQWKNAAYSNNSRFAAIIPDNYNGSTLSYTTVYNLNPVDVSISGTNITINKSGLWHFEGYVHERVAFNTPPTALAFSAWFAADGMTHSMLVLSPMDRNPMVIGDVEYVKMARFSNDVYISAPATISVGRTANLIGGGALMVSRLAYGTVSGFLISE